MRNKTDSDKNSPVGITPSVPWRVCEVRALDSYRLYVRFVDGLEGFVNLSHLIKDKNAGVFSLLLDPDLFDSVYLKYGAVTWPGELDLSPDAMYDAIKEHGEWTVQ